MSSMLRHDLSRCLNSSSWQNALSSPSEQASDWASTVAASP
eukprot:CAMPEP_0196755800 /NCGR_PEP_ID=MMETSP1091-20130531/98758_1 /TAXON_ID=302021 /ORGANISM="Rhodomonas sp., Strain CCMP768" /LENGTH=40 /DNA_ID= /DNA_START= /DNA_END= /DNA_ORIENTATION=